MSASANLSELFDIESSSTSKRELGSVNQNKVIKPLLILEGHDGVEDIAFKNN